MLVHRGGNSKGNTSSPVLERRKLAATFWLLQSSLSRSTQRFGAGAGSSHFNGILKWRQHVGTFQDTQAVRPSFEAKRTWNIKHVKCGVEIEVSCAWQMVHQSIPSASTDTAAWEPTCMTCLSSADLIVCAGLRSLAGEKQTFTYLSCRLLPYGLAVILH